MSRLYQTLSSNSHVRTKKPGPSEEGPGSCRERWTLEVHAAHATGRIACGRSGLLGLVGDDGLGGEEQSRDRRCVLQRRAGDLGRVDDARREQVLVLAGRGVEAVPRAGCGPCPTTTPASRPALIAICLSGASSATRTMFAPVASSPSSSSFVDVRSRPAAARRHRRQRCPLRRQPWRCALRPRCGACAP